MKRKIYLYIADQMADLQEDALVLMNYAFTDVEKPTAVKNSYSKQITLPGTPANNAIFGHFYRLDRRTWAGFNALQRTPFHIMDDLGAVLQRGYLKLDSVTRKGGIVSGYKVTLYGGLGDFFYALGYNEAGDKLTLADLDYLGGGEGELDFDITAANVAAAWARLQEEPEEYDSLWDVINFAPAYNGIPDGDFSADKAIGNCLGMGLADIKYDGSTMYSARGGNTLVTLAQPHTEWDMKDLRCYLQRPVLSIRAFLEAVKKWAEAHDFSFDYSDLPLYAYKDLWKTLPMLPSLGSFKQDAGSLTTSFVERAGSEAQVLSSEITIVGVQASQSVTARLDSFTLGFLTPGDYANPGYLRTRQAIAGRRDEAGAHSVIFVQLQGYAGGAIVAASPTRCYADGEMADLYRTPARMAQLAGFTPAFLEEFEPTIERAEYLFLGSDAVQGYYHYLTGGAPMSLKGTAVTSLRLSVHCYTFLGVYERKDSGFLPFAFSNATSAGRRIYWWDAPDASISGYYRSTGAAWIAGTASATFVQNSSLRSGAHIEKAQLLSSKHTPADYLLSLARQFGWAFYCDEAGKAVTIMQRNSFFSTGESAIDLTDKIDTSRDIVITPNYAGARIYEFAPEVAPGHFAEEYAKAYGFGYGIQRVDTGYQFDADPVDLLDKSVFRAAATILESGPYWFNCVWSSKNIPIVFIDKGNTYALWASDGSSKNFEILTPPSSATISPESDLWGYDNEFAWKLDLHDAEGKGVDGEDILVYYTGVDTYGPRWHISDDTPEMLALNDNKPCWSVYNGEDHQLFVPNFQRYQTNTEQWVEASLDFGTPREVDIPWIEFRDYSSSYVRGWAAFLRDRYDADTKVMKCRVNFRGIQVGPELLRRFYYYEGTYWALNKITNYSLTTWDPVECEFIQVRNISAYTDGQNWEA